jgi:hypothetical protein
MANLKFSENGVPMGRNKKATTNGNSQWSTAEDNYLQMAAEQNIPAGIVAAKLGRSNASIYTRKWQLGIKNNTSVPRVKTSKKQATKLETPAPKGVQLFTLESGVPVPGRGRHSNDEARTQLRGIFNKMSTGQSFVVPKNVVHVATHLVKKEFGAFKIRTSATSADKKFFRIFRVA